MQGYNTQGVPSDQKQPIELFLACRNLKDMDAFSKSDPIVRLFIKTNGQWVQVGHTEMQQDKRHPNFKTTIKTDYIFEQKQECRFDVMDDDGGSEELIGNVETTIGTLAGADKNTSTFDLHNKKSKTGQLIVKLDKIAVSNEYVFWEWQGKKLKNLDGFFGKSDPYLKIVRVSEGNQGFVSYSSEQIMDNLNPKWKGFEISLSKVCYGDHSRKFAIEAWDWEKSDPHKIIGRAMVTIDEMVKGAREFEVKTEKGKSAGHLVLSQFTLIQRPTFMDYI
jgi:hypothetical protein